MNDITALMATMKASAEKAKEFDEERLYIKASNVLTLIEALEKSQNWERQWKEAAERRGKRLTRQALEILQQEQRISELESDLAAEEERRSNWFRMAEELGGKLDAAEERIAELESRTVTVKLPKRTVSEVMLLSGFDRQYAEGWCSGNDNAINEMKLAGIQVIEGEGQ